jgi:hypothetical protein
MAVVVAGDAAPGNAAAKEPAITPPAAPQAPAPGPQAAPQPPEELPIAIVWNAPDECPGIDALKAEIRRVAGQAPPPAEPLSATVTVRRSGGNGWLLSLVTASGTRAGERKLAGPDCAELMRAAALVLALMINPQASLLAEPPPPPPPLPPPPPPPPAPEQPFAVGVDLLAGSGALPGLAAGFGLRIAAGTAALSAELRASLWLPRSTASDNEATAGGRFYLADASAAGCARALHDQSLSPALCVGGSLVRLHGSGYGVGFPSEASAWWTAAFAEANLRARVSRGSAVRLAGAVVMSLGRPSFELAGVGHVFEPASFWLRATLGWELHF